VQEPKRVVTIRDGETVMVQRYGLASALAALAVGVAVLGGAGQAAAAGRAGGPAAAAGAGVISTVAGGVGGPGRATGVALSPCGVSYGGGRLYFGTGGAVREVSPASDWLTTPAGTGVPGPLADGGPAVKASLDSACGTAVDQSGNLVIADRANNRVRVVAASTATFYGQPMTAGDIYTVAGNGGFGFSGDGGPATSAELSLPDDVAVDGAGNLVIADSNNLRVRVVAASTGTFYGQPMTAGDIYTVAGGGRHGLGDGGPATSAELSPEGVAVDGAGNLVISDIGDTGSNRVRVVADSTGAFYGQPMTAGDIYTVAGGGDGSGSGVPATSVLLFDPDGVAVDGAGNLVIADSGLQEVMVVADSTGSFYGQPMTAGDIYTVAGTGGSGFSGDGGPATSAWLRQPDGVAVDGAGNLAISDSGNDRVRVVAASTGSFYGRPMTKGHIYTVAGNGGIALGSSGFSGDGGPATHAELSYPDAVAVDGAGNLVTADFYNQVIQVAAASTGRFYGQPMTKGHIYAVAGDGQYGFSGDGGPATSAELNSPDGVAVDGAGNLVITDLGNQRVRVVAASTGSFYGQPMTAGDIYTVAGGGTGGLGDGGPATSAELNSPDGVAVDGAGNLVITAGRRVRVVAASTGSFYGQPMTAGDIYTVAGDGKRGFSGDGHPATRAELFDPDGVAVDGAGNLMIADTGNHRIREVSG
jgi:secreted PhoX family phosphatase